jgi:hypothetical protein
MTNTALYTKISTLPLPLQNEVYDFIEFLIQKQQIKKDKIHPKAGCMKGIFYTTADFNEPIEVLKKL